MFGHFVPGVNGVEPVEGSRRIGRTGGKGFDGVIFVARSRPGPLVFFCIVSVFAVLGRLYMRCKEGFDMCAQPQGRPGRREGKEGLDMSHDSRHGAVLCCAVPVHSSTEFPDILSAAAKLQLLTLCRSSSVL